MSTQLYLAQGISEGRAWHREDPAVLRDVELERAGERRERRASRRAARRA